MYVKLFSVVISVHFLLALVVLWFSKELLNFDFLLIYVVNFVLERN